MRFLRAFPALAPLLVLCGCGYIHFGRLPEAAAPTGGDRLGVAYSNLSTEHKILQQELALARAEGDALRAVLDSRTDGASAELTARLNETSRELATLRASYAKLQAARASPATAPDLSAAATAKADAAQDAGLSMLEEKLAASLRSYTELQGENARLRTQVDQTRAENTALASQVKTGTAQNAAAQSALAQLNTEFLAQKEARTRAEQQAESARAQLSAVMAARDNPAPPSLASARESSAASTATLRLAAAPPSDQPATAELRTSPERLRAADEPTKAAPNAASSASSGPAPRIHVVQFGDTLEQIAKKYYGNPARWQRIYLANNALLSGGRPLKPGMELEIPED
jgi:nucleoid-associated protein YgaU